MLLIIEAKLALSLVGLTLLVSGVTPYKVNYYVMAHAVQTSAFAATGFFALKRVGHDPRLRTLGIFLLLIAANYSRSLTTYAVGAQYVWNWPAAIVQGLRCEAFAAWYFLLFAESFPRAHLGFTLRRIAIFIKRLTLMAGLFFLCVVSPIRIYRYLAGIEMLSLPLELLAEIIIHQWHFLMPFGLFGFSLIIYNFSMAPRTERRRAKIFLAGILFGFGIPTVDSTLDGMGLGLIPLPPGKASHFTYNSILFSGLVVISYALLAHKVLDVRLLARNAMKHVLARYVATALGLAPFLFLVVFLFQQRDHTVAQLFSGSRATVLVVAALLGATFLRYRGPILDAIDRRFFRERYNARRVLTQLAEQVRGTRNLEELSNMVGQGVDLALHLEGVSLLAQDPSVGQLVDPLDRVRPLDAASPLATLLQGHPEPLEVDLSSPTSPLQALRNTDKHWLIDSQVEMLAPAYALDGSMIGVLALGPKKSELPFLREDRELLTSVCSAVGLVIELLFLKEQTPLPYSRTSWGDRTRGRGRDSHDPEQTDYPLDQLIEQTDSAMECLGCDAVYPPGEERCPRCTVELSPTLVPYVLGGQYRIEKRLGAGGMAIVYLATDLKLGRSVAIKTLPRVSPEAAMRLHREARTAATVTHPGLAAIYGLETWQGVPMLILEYLPGGTLADQLMASESLDPLLAIEMGKSVALALHKIHTAGILHRDIKPSNIGYTDEGFAKLLDFGVARLQFDLRREPATEGDAQDDSRSRIMNTASWVIGRTATGQLVGTFGYLSPEAVRGLRPEPAFDIWALSVVLWESLTGENLFAERVVKRTLDRIRDVKVKEIDKIMPDCPEPVVRFFERELHPDRGRRAQSGQEMVERLEALRVELVS